MKFRFNVLLFSLLVFAHSIHGMSGPKEKSKAQQNQSWTTSAYNTVFCKRTVLEAVVVYGGYEFLKMLARDNFNWGMRVAYYALHTDNGSKGFNYNVFNAVLQILKMPLYVSRKEAAAPTHAAQAEWCRSLLAQAEQQATQPQRQ